MKITQPISLIFLAWVNRTCKAVYNLNPFDETVPVISSTKNEYLCANDD